MDYKLIRSRRKSVALIVERDGSLVVRAPLRLPQREIDAFVAKNAAWIQEKQAAARQRAETCGGPPGEHRFAAGENFLFLGQAIPLQIVEAQAHPLTYTGQAFRLKRSALPRAGEFFEGWYKAQARADFTHRVEALAARHGFSVRSLRLSSARTRWGSCGAQGSLNLNWRLVMAPPEVIDYVILHELAHLKERNHSARFWALVATLAPDYKTQRQWLKTNGMCLSWP